MICEFNYNEIPIKLLFSNPEDFLSKQILTHNTFYENRYLTYLYNNHRQLISRSNGIILDVGANIGNHTIFFSKVLKYKVIAFEPQPELYDILCENIILNGVEDLVVAKNLALSSKRKNLEIIKRYDNMVGSTQMWYSNNAKNPQLFESVPLDDIILHRVDFIKIDVEGMEMEVLRGSSKLINKYFPPIMIETTDIDGHGLVPTRNNFNTWLIKHNYQKIGVDDFNKNTHLVTRRTYHD